jgi:protein-tyrosine phosphatase
VIDYKKVKSVLFVCMGNICRSPTAEAVFKHKCQQAGLPLAVDSAGTIGAHVREKPDARAQKAGQARGYQFEGIRARKVTVKDFGDFDLVLAMDNDNLRDLQNACPLEYQHKVQLFLHYGNGFPDSQVPDPYYGGAGGFEYVLDLIEDASDGLLQKIKQ